MKNKANSTYDTNEETHLNITSKDFKSFLFHGTPEKVAALPSFSLISPSKFAQKLLLNKKRKISDLNLAKESPSIKNRPIDRIFSPFRTDTKITAYFPHKKSSSYKKTATNSLMCFETNSGTKEKTNHDSSFSTEDKVSFAKRLVFDDLDKTINFDDKNINYNFNIKFESDKTRENTMNWNLSSEVIEKGEEEVDNLKFNSDSKVVKCLLYPKISKKTKEIINHSLKIRKTCTPKKTQTKNLNLNFENIIKKINNLNSTNGLNSNDGSNNSSKVNSPNKKRIRKSSLIKNANKVINAFSMKEKYEELLNRDLMIPCHFKSLLKKIVKLDETLNYFKREASSNLNSNVSNFSISKINKFFSEKFSMNFSLEDFQKILFIAPHFFIYKWDREDINEQDKKLNKNLSLLQSEIFIDFPNDIPKRMEENYSEKSNFTNLQTFPFIPLKNTLPLEKDVLLKRTTIFKKILLHLTNEYHKKFIKEKGLVTKLNPFKHRTWHSEFDVHGVAEIELYKIIDRPFFPSLRH